MPDEKVYLQHIGKLIRFVRTYKKEKTITMAIKLGYSDSSSYAKIERGAYNSVCILKIIKIFKILHVNPLVLFYIDKSVTDNNVNDFSTAVEAIISDSFKKIVKDKALEIILL